MMRNNVKKLLSCLLVFLLLLSSGSAFAVEEFELTESVDSYLVGDFETGKILLSKNIDTPIHIASITKIVTYAVVMDKVKSGEIGLFDEVTIDYDTANIGGSSMKLQAGEVLTVDELLRGMLIVSANDASFQLAKYVSGTEEAFVFEMMSFCHSKGVETAEFYNASGLPGPSLDGSYENRFYNKMSVRDIFAITQYIFLEYPEAREISSELDLVMPNRDFDEKNTNNMLGLYEGVDGFKTGYTDGAGYCLVSSHTNLKTSPDDRLICIVMGSDSVESRTRATTELLDFALENYTRVDLLDPSRPVEAIPLKNAKGGFVKVYSERGIKDIRKTKDYMDARLEIDKISIGMKKGEEVGTAFVYEGDTIVEEIKLVLREDVVREKGQGISGFFTGLFKKFMGLFRK